MKQKNKEYIRRTITLNEILDDIINLKINDTGLSRSEIINEILRLHFLFNNYE